ncbi:MAG: tyrosine-type recombinase/integrase [Lachnospiraceae bacterium]|nr:tyrosine-type recombinase/integrase [Lachnospiraceae bacterium]
MHKEYEYKSVFAKRITNYILTRREAGFMFDNPAYWLFRFDRFCYGNKVKEEFVSKQLFDLWASRTSMESKTTQRNRLEALKNFSVYLNSIGIPSYIPASLPSPEKTIPYLMTDSDIREFFEQVDLYDTRTTKDSFKRMAGEYKVLFRLIYCCGLRNNEACSLRTEDVDVPNGIINIYHSKGRKDRVVYLSDDLQTLCSDYIDWLNGIEGYNREWFFPGRDINTHIQKTSLDKKFNEFWNATKISSSCDKKPTVHCLRHAYVIKRMNLWMDEDVPLNVMMPYLSSFLGHNGPMETYYYYHQIKDTFRTIKRKDKVSSRVIPEVQHEE